MEIEPDHRTGSAPPRVGAILRSRKTGATGAFTGKSTWEGYWDLADGKTNGSCFAVKPEEVCVVHPDPTGVRASVMDSLKMRVHSWGESPS